MAYLHLTHAEMYLVQKANIVSRESVGHQCMMNVGDPVHYTNSVWKASVPHWILEVMSLRQLTAILEIMPILTHVGGRVHHTNNVCKENVGHPSLTNVGGPVHNTNNVCKDSVLHWILEVMSLRLLTGTLEIMSILQVC